MDEYVRAAREQAEPWDRIREQRVLESTLEELEAGGRPRVATSAGREWGRRGSRVLVAAALGGLLVVSGVLTWVLLQRAEPGAGRGVTAGARGVKAAAKTSSIRFADGSEAVVYGGGRVVVREQRPTRILLDQLAGAALFRVTRRPERRFEVVAEGLTIRVVGTRFKVTLLPARWVRVEVEEGLVEVEYEGQTVRLGAGDSLRVSRESWAKTARARRAVGSPQPVVVPAPMTPAPVVPGSGSRRPPVRIRPAPRPAPAPTPAAASAPTGSPRPRPSPAVVQAQKEERDWIAATMRQVDAARRAGRYAEAVKLIRGLIAKYPHNWRVSTAAFIWARVEHARGRPTAAAKAYALYRRRSPSGPLAEDALAGEARARRAAGQTTLARKLARSYLKKYPRGTHAKAMRSVMR